MKREVMSDGLSHRFGNFVTSWPIPRELSDFQSYGLWNSLSAYDQEGKLLGIMPAQDGDFFPETPLDHIERIRDALVSGKSNYFTLWPVRVDIDITQRCTSNCYYCYSRLYAIDPLYRDAEIPVSTFEKILKELVEGGTRSIRFTGGGEPLLHPEIRKMLPMPKHHGLRSCILTNGELLNEEISKLLVSNIDLIRVSINAAKDDTRRHLHRPITRVNDLSKIFQQLRYMVQLRNMIRPYQKRPLIWTTFLLLPENVNEIYLTAKILRDCGVDSISFRPIYHNLSHPFSDEEMKIIKNQLKLALSLHFPPLFHVFTPKRNISTVWQISPRTQFLRCISCRLRTIIEATNTYPVIKLCGLHRGTNGNSLGFVKEGVGFSKAWYSTPAQKILSNRPETCERCIDISMNVTLNEVKDILVEHPEAVFRKSWHRDSIT